MLYGDIGAARKCVVDHRFWRRIVPAVAERQTGRSQGASLYSAEKSVLSSPAARFDKAL